MSSDKLSVTVIGAGVVGLSCACWLLRDGHDVTVIDPVAPGESCSFGNAGIISKTSVIPLAMPGVIAKVPGWLLDPLGPLAVRWSYLPRATPWLLRLLAAGRRSRVAEIADALGALNAPTIDAYHDLLGAGAFADLIRHDGVLNAYESVAAFEADSEAWDMRRARGTEFERIDGGALREMEPALSPDIPCAMYVPDTAHTINPLRLVKTLADRFLAGGGKIMARRADRVVCGPEGPRSLSVDGASHGFDALVVAAGAWSHRLASQMGSRVPLEAERGYHVTIEAPGVDLKRPVSLASRGFYATPLELGLRIAGTVEFGGVDAPPNYRRARVLLDHGRRLFPALDGGSVSEWMGCRPSLPDSLPVIGRSPLFSSVYYAFGHGHLGLTEGAITGKLIAEMIAGRPTTIDVAPYRVDRF